MISEELQEGTRRERRHLWRLSETLCLNPAGGLSCHSASSFCSRLQAILLSACTRGKGSIELQPNREGKPTGLAANRTDWGEEGGCAYLSGRRGGARHGGGGWVLGEGNRIVEEDGRGLDEGEGEEGGQEGEKPQRSRAICPFFICGFFYVGPLCEKTCKWTLQELFPTMDPHSSPTLMW